MMIERSSMSVMVQAVIWTAVKLNCNLMQIMIMFSNDP